MAEYSAVIAIVRPLIDKLVQLLSDKANLFKDVRREVQSLADELEAIHCFLNAAEERGEMSDGAKTTVKQFREEAYRAETVIDRYTIRAVENHHCGIVSFARKICCFVKGAIHHHEIASEVKKIKASLREIKERGERYGFSSLERRNSGGSTRTKRSVDLRLGSLFIEDDELVDIECMQDNLTRWLLGGSTSRSVMALVGRGGIGKTTLARQAHDNERVKRHFECQAWLGVSLSYDVKTALKTMARHVRQSDERFFDDVDTTEDLIAHLRQYLRKKRYLVVLDDVWHIEFWEIIKNALPGNEQGSRVIITTRNDLVASFCTRHSCNWVQKLGPWPQEKSWELFCKTAFDPESGGRCPEELEQLSLEIVKKCEGLPLVIAAIAGLLSTKEKVTLEWRKIRDDLSSDLQTNPFLSHCSKILSLGYQDLSPELKSCFLYFGLYPKNYAIPYPKLFGKWITEGFIKEGRNKTQEQVAEEFLTELVERNLVQTWKSNRHEHRYCQVHDLMHEIILSKASEQGFSQTFDERNSRLFGKTRRLSICNNHDSVLESVNDPGVRSILFYNVIKLTTSYLATMFEKFKLLKVLDLADVQLDGLPEEVGNLLHLNYLSLHNTNLKTLPKSIGRLESLKILDIRNTLVHKLPREITRLRCLGHLLANFHNKDAKYSSKRLRGVIIPRGIGSLENLQTLITVEANPTSCDIAKELENLKQLRSLSISNLTTETVSLIYASIEKMSRLEALDFRAINDNEVLDLQSISLPRRIQNLSILSKLQKLPDSIASLHNLSRLNLSFSRLSDNPLKHLDKLPNLEHLFLYRAYIGGQLNFEENGFRNLKTLALRALMSIEAVTMSKGAMPRLEELEIGPSPMLKELPSEIRCLRSLTRLTFYGMEREFVLGLQPSVGSEHCKVMNIRHVCFCYRVDGLHYNRTWKLGDPDLLEHLQAHQQALL